MNNKTATKPSVILFDVNETLLDMAPLKKKVNKLMDSKRGFRIWFGLLLQYSLVDNCTGTYHDFLSIADATLDMAAIALNEEVDATEKLEALSLFAALPAYNDAKEGLLFLKERGYRLATLTNSPNSTMMQQLQNAEILSYFDATLSVDSVKKYKPATETYHWAAKELGVPVGEVLMVAAHGWDIAGAAAAGMQTAFIERKGQSLYHLAPPPAYSTKGILELGDQLTLNFS